MPPRKQLRLELEDGDNDAATSCSSDDEAVAAQPTFLTTFYACAAFNAALCYVLKHFGNVLSPKELQRLAQLNQLDARPKELLLRLACRKSDLHLLSRIRDAYGQSVMFAACEEGPVRLRSPSQHPSTSAALDEALSTLQGAGYVAVATVKDLLSNDEQRKMCAVPVFSLLLVLQLKELAAVVCQQCCLTEAVPQSKQQLLDFMVRHLDAAIAAWNLGLFGELLTISSETRLMLTQLFKWYQILAPETSSLVAPAEHQEPSPVMPLSLILPMFSQCSFPMAKHFSEVNNDGADGPMHFYDDRRSLDLMEEGLDTENKLFDLESRHSDDSRSPAVLRPLYTTTKQRLTAALSLQRAEEMGRFPLSQRSATGSNPFALNVLLSQQTHEHLAVLLPSWQWFGCLERLLPMLESAKLYEESSEGVQFLLSTPVFLRPRCCPLWYKPRKRGYFAFRNVVNLSHLRQLNTAVSYGEATILASNAASDAQWKGDHMKTFLRRSDRISLERSTLKLYVPPRRWCAPPKQLLSLQLLEATHQTIRGQREGSGEQRWIGTHHNAGTVESRALQWYVAGRGRKEKGWKGAHCEGSWVSSLFSILFHEILYNEKGKSTLTYLTPTQLYPLDFSIPGHWYSNNAKAIDAELAALSHLTQDEFVSRVSSFVQRYHDVEQQRPTVRCAVNWKLPLPELARFVPLRPLHRLFQTLLTSPTSAGHCLRFSGFPDLVLWREGSVSIERVDPSLPNFLLSEVKGPNDKLSDKQLAVIDLLLRSGFCVEVMHVADADDVCASRPAIAPIVRHPLRKREKRGRLVRILSNGAANPLRVDE